MRERAGRRRDGFRDHLSYRDLRIADLADLDFSLDQLAYDVRPTYH